MSLALVVLQSSAAAWADIAGALTYKGTSHVFQGCPGGKQPGSTAKGWHHAASTDLVHWEDRGIHVEAIAESYEGFTSNTSPCSGFVAVDDDGVPCAGFRQCGSITGLTGLNPRAHKWDAPLEIRCATNANLTAWGKPDYLFPVYFYRGLPYDPTRPWKDADGKWYATISTDGCNTTRYPANDTDRNCPAGGRLDLWTSPKLHGAGSDWKYVGPMITTPKTPIDSSATHEFVTSGYFGEIPGDPRGGKTRVVTNNDCNHGATNMGTPIYYVGQQSNGSPFKDTAGGQEFTGQNEIGMIDWGAYTPKTTAESKGAKGVKALKGGNPRGYSMARTLGSDPNQVAVKGRRTIVAWVSSAFTSQSLLQDLSMGGTAADPYLKQTFIPELAMLRESKIDLSAAGAEAVAGQQFEVLATVKSAADGGGGKTSFQVLVSAAGSTSIGIDWDAGLVYVDGRKQGNNVLRAGPLLGVQTTANLHVYVDHSIIAVICNNRTSLTVAVGPDADATGMKLPSSGVTAEAWTLKTANRNSHLEAQLDAPCDCKGIGCPCAAGTPPKPNWVPKIHNSPACLH